MAYTLLVLSQFVNHVITFFQAFAHGCNISYCNVHFVCS